MTKSSTLQNDIACKMLQKQPFDLVCSKEYQQSVLKIVRKFKQKGGFLQDTEADVVQEITTIILEQRITYMQKNYAPKYGNVKHYFEKVVYNLAVEQVRKSHKRQNFSQDLAKAPLQRVGRSRSNDTLSDELKKLALFMNKTGRQSAKLYILFKMYSRAIINKQDFLNYYPDLQKEELNQLLEVFGQNYAHFDDRDLYAKLYPLINKVENKKNSADAVRKWLGSRITELNDWMNRHSTFKYDREALRSLIGVFFVGEGYVIS